MLRRSRLRLTATLLVVMSMLFSQLALASYVCPAQTDTGTMAEMMGAGQPCDGMDEAQPVLCHQHSTDATQSFQVFKLPAASWPMLVQVLFLPLVPDPAEVQTLPTASTAEARPPPGLLFLSTLRLRI
jgi:hypothetical protein